MLWCTCMITHLRAEGLHTKRRKRHNISKFYYEKLKTAKNTDLIPGLDQSAPYLHSAVVGWPQLPPNQADWLSSDTDRGWSSQGKERGTWAPELLSACEAHPSPESKAGPVSPLPSLRCCLWCDFQHFGGLPCPTFHWEVPTSPWDGTRELHSGIQDFPVGVKCFKVRSFTLSPPLDLLGVFAVCIHFELREVRVKHLKMK